MLLTSCLPYSFTIEKFIEIRGKHLFFETCNPIGDSSLLEDYLSPSVNTKSLNAKRPLLNTKTFVIANSKYKEYRHFF